MTAIMASNTQNLNPMQRYFGIQAADSETQGTVSLLSVNVATAPKEAGGHERWISAYGLSDLDTESLSGVAPDEDGSDSFDKINSKSVTIEGRQGTPEAQLLSQDFKGSTTIIATRDRPAAPLDRLIGKLDKKPVVLVGYDIQQQLDALQEAFKIDLKNDLNVIITINIVDFYNEAGMSVPGYEHKYSLAAVLNALSVDTQSISNPGNRSIYHIQAFIKLAVNAATARVQQTSVSAAVSTSASSRTAQAAPSDRDTSTAISHGVTSSSPNAGNAPEGARVVHRSRTAGADFPVTQTPTVPTASSTTSSGPASNGTPVANNSSGATTTSAAARPTGTSTTSTVAPTLRRGVASSTPPAPRANTPSTQSTSTSQAVPTPSSTPSSDAARQSTTATANEGYTRTCDVTVPDPISEKSRNNKFRTYRVGNWLVKEAKRYEPVEVEDDYTYMGHFYDFVTSTEQPINRLDYVHIYVKFANIIKNHSGVHTTFDAAVRDELRILVKERKEVSAFYANGISVAPGSLLDEENKRHQHFNDQMKIVLDVLIEAKARKDAVPALSRAQPTAS